MRSALISLGLFVLILAGGLGISTIISSQKEPAPKLPAVDNVTQASYHVVQNQTHAAQVEVNGRLVARDKIELFSEVNGTYRSTGKLFKEGVYFAKGETMLNLTDAEFQMALRAQKSAFANQITLMLPDLKTDYGSSFPRWVAYLDSLDIDKPLPQLPEASSDQERYYLTARNVLNTYYTIQGQEARLKKYLIQAPFNGRVSQSAITPGTLVRSGQKLGEFFNPSSYELEASVSLRDLPFTQPGSAVELRSEDIPGTWNGRVLRISDVIDATTQTVRVFISVSGSSLKEGMYLRGTVSGKPVKDVVSIDRRLLMDDNSVFLATLKPAPSDSVNLTLQPATLKKAIVEPVQYSEGKVLVRGLENGMMLINQSIPNAYDGMSVALYSNQ